MKVKVGVFFGGRSVEHEVSIISASQAMHAMDTEKYEVVPVYITKKGFLYTGSPLLDIANYKDIDKLLSICTRVNIVNDGNRKVLVKYPAGLFGTKEADNIDVAFPVVHGTNVEDGTLQGYLESLDIPYVGCDVLSSAVGMDKVIMKMVLKEAELPVLDYVAFYSKEWLRNGEELTRRIEEKLGYPVIVKPANLGSSVGIKKAASREELEEAIDLARSFATKILVETAVVNLREINCSVLGDYEKAEASVCEEPVSSDEILSYKDKYMGGGSKGGSKDGKGMGGASRKLPAELSEERTQLVRSLAVRTFKALGCSGVSRVDFLIDKDTDQVYVNEINTIPGSLSFYLWEAAGKSFQCLCNELIQLALKRSRERNELVFSYESNLLSMKGSKNGIK